VNAGREAGAQFGLEARARAAVLGTAEEIRADDVPPAAALAWLPGGSLDRPAGRGGRAGRVSQLVRRLRDLGFRSP
jgi:hypothetical protein